MVPFALTIRECVSYNKMHVTNANREGNVEILCDGAQWEALEEWLVAHSRDLFPALVSVQKKPRYYSLITTAITTHIFGTKLVYGKE